MRAIEFKVQFRKIIIQTPSRKSRHANATPPILTPHMAPKRPLLAFILTNQVRRKEFTPFEKGQIVAFNGVGLSQSKIAKVFERPC